MSESGQVYARLAPGVLDVPALAAAVARIVDHVDARLPSIVEAILQACRLEIPEYEGLSPEWLDLQRERDGMGIGLITGMIRAGQTCFSPTERATLVALGRELVKEPKPLHAVIRGYQIAARELINEAVALVPDLGAMAAPALSVTLRIGFGLLSQFIEVIAEGFTEGERDAGLRWSDPRQSLVSDLVLGVVPETFDARARHAGLVPRPWYRAVVCLVGSDTDPSPWTKDAEAILAERLPPGCVFGRVGHLGIVVSGGSDDADPTPEIAQVLEGDLSRGNRVLVAIGPPREHLSGVRESFEAAVAVIEAGRALGTGGLLAAGKTAVPRLVAAARSAGLEVTTVLNPVLSVDPVEAEELSRALGAYVRNACSVQRAATALHVHRNTMRRRLQRAQELLAFSIAERWLEVELALIALESSDLTAAASAR